MSRPASTPALILAVLIAGVAPAPAQANDTLTPGQVAAAQQVFTGEADCEFKQKIGIHPVEGRPGYFKLAYKRAHYVLVVQETSTGAVRLEDPRSGIVWIQIPAKSMLMNSHIAQRLVDSCQHPAQKSTGNQARGGEPQLLRP